MFNFSIIVTIGNFFFLCIYSLLISFFDLKFKKNLFQISIKMAKNQVIIIGGGVSGLTAANELIDAGITNIVILEAQNRLGGRIFTTQSKGALK